jgi:hypothetical protein
MVEPLSHPLEPEHPPPTTGGTASKPLTEEEREWLRRGFLLSGNLPTDNLNSAMRRVLRGGNSGGLGGGFSVAATASLAAYLLFLLGTHFGWFIGPDFKSFQIISVQPLQALADCGVFIIIPAWALALWAQRAEASHHARWLLLHGPVEKATEIDLGMRIVAQYNAMTRAEQDGMGPTRRAALDFGPLLDRRPYLSLWATLALALVNVFVAGAHLYQRFVVNPGFRWAFTSDTGFQIATWVWLLVSLAGAALSVRLLLHFARDQGKFAADWKAFLEKIWRE